MSTPESSAISLGGRRAKRERPNVRARFEDLLLELATAFARAPAGNTPELIEKWTRRLTHLLGVDQGSLWEVTLDDDTIHRRHVYSVPGVDGVLSMTPQYRSEWLVQHYLRERVVHWPHIPDDVPAEAAAERMWSQRLGMKSILGIPIFVGTSIHVLAFHSVQAYRRWSPKEIRRLRLVVEIFAGALARHAAETSLQASETRIRAILKAQPDLIFVQRPDGVYLDYHGGDRSDLLRKPERFLGRNVCEVLPPELAQTFLSAFRRAAETCEVVTVDYELPILGAQRAFEARVVRCDDGTVLTVVRNVSERRSAQLEIERLRLELGHLGRITLTGQLTSALAHELIQPISSIATNAEAGLQALVPSVAPPAESLRAILTDIAASSKLAAESIHRVRRFVTKEYRPHVRVNVNRLVAEVAEVMRTDLMLRQVHLELQLAEALPRVRGDSVELQQVLLNLLVNGAEALGSRPVHERKLIIGTTASANAVEIIVRDFGLGVAPSDLPRLFEPFFTTKPAGLGMGLAICAEIVRSHGGILAAENAPDGGLLVRCRLPPSNPSVS